MSKSNWNIIKQIELLNEYITDECSEYLYYQPRYNGKIFEKIKNASTMLLNNSMRLVRNQKALIYKEDKKELTIEETKEILFKMYQIIIQPEMPINKEDKIKKMMRDNYNLNSDKLLQNNPPIALQEIRNRLLLNGYYK